MKSDCDTKKSSRSFVETVKNAVDCDDAPFLYCTSRKPLTIPCTIFSTNSQYR